jgi:hypothetical protein
VAEHEARGGTLILGGGFAGSYVPRSQLPLLSRKLRVVTDWTVALFFRRDLAQLGTIGHPGRVGDG